MYPPGVYVILLKYTHQRVPPVQTAYSWREVRVFVVLTLTSLPVPLAALLLAIALSIAPHGDDRYFYYAARYFFGRPLLGQ